MRSFITVLSGNDAGRDELYTSSAPIQLYSSVDPAPIGNHRSYFYFERGWSQKFCWAKFKRPLKFLNHELLLLPTFFFLFILPCMIYLSISYRYPLIGCPRYYNFRILIFLITYRVIFCAHLSEYFYVRASLCPRVSEHPCITPKFRRSYFMCMFLFKSPTL